MANNVYSRVAKMILDDFILLGKVSPGERLPSIRDLQDHYSVGRSTVWHALGALELQGYVTTKRGSGCYVKPQRFERTAQMGNVIGFVGDSSVGALCYQLQRGVDWVCEKRDCQLLVSSTHNEYVTEQQQVTRMIQNGCSGIVLSPSPRTRAQLEGDYLRTLFQDVPIVLIDIAYEEQERTRVVFDNYQAGYDMTEALIKEGHERIAFMNVPDDYMLISTKERYMGYCDAMASAGLSVRDVDLFTVCLDTPDSQFEDILRQWKSRSDRYTAIITLHDGVAMAMIAHAKVIGIQIPDELAIAGFDNYAGTHSLKPTFPTTAPDLFQAGRIAARLLIEEINSGKRQSSTYLLPLPVKVRGLGAIRQAVESALEN